MSDSETCNSAAEGAPGDTPSEAPRRDLPEAAKRALAEAEARRAAARQEMSQKEIGGTGGPDPVRYGDWEKDGIASDF